ncbi:unnamed protein product [Amoebophrya sp. A25]|nr:unnamed protein product [Amoebophrya sp. A25]|eukprot:GSA25T00024525001.1
MTLTMDSTYHRSKTTKRARLFIERGHQMDLKHVLELSKISRQHIDFFASRFETTKTFHLRRPRQSPCSTGHSMASKHI